MATQMPIINLDDAVLDDDERKLAQEIIKKDGRLYASKPKKASAAGKYVWRMLVFSVSPKPQHHCMPVTADWDLMDEFRDWDERRTETKRLDDIVKRLGDTVPPLQHYGAMRWGRALGML